MAKSSVEKYQPGPKRSLFQATFNLEASKKNYQALLTQLAGIKVTKDNVNEDQTKDAKEVIKALTELKDIQCKPVLQDHKDILNVYNGLVDPIKEQLDRIAEEKKAVSIKIQQETAAQLREQARINNAKQAIVNFSNKVATLITESKTDSDIVAIEKMIGSEKVKSSLYQEFLPELIERCDALRPQIKTQKDNIRQLKALEEKEKIAIESGNIAAATEILEKKEELQGLIEETTIRIHETAFDQAASIEIMAPEVIDTAPKGRTNWRWRVDDIRLLAKKMPGLVKVVPDEDAIGRILAEKRLDGSLKDKLEENWNGIVFYNDKSFK